MAEQQKSWFNRFLGSYPGQILVRDVLGVAVGIVPFAMAIAGADLAVEKGALGQFTNRISNKLGGGQKQEQIPDGAKISVDKTATSFLKGFFRNWISVGAGFGTFGVIYGEWRKFYNEQFVDNGKEEEKAVAPGVQAAHLKEAKEEAAVERTPAVKKFFTTGAGKVIFRDLGAAFVGCIPLGIIASAGDKFNNRNEPMNANGYKLCKGMPEKQLSEDEFSGRCPGVSYAMDTFYAKGDKTYKKEGNNFFEIDAEGNKVRENIKKRWVKDWRVAASAYASFFVTSDQYRKLYDKFWDNYGKDKSPASNDNGQAKQADALAKPQGATAQEESLKEAAEAPKKEHYHFWTKGLGKIIFRDVAQVMAGFAAHRLVRMWLNDRADDPEGKGTELGKLAKAGKEGNSPMSPRFIKEVVGTGVGFAIGYRLIGQPYMDAYDKIFAKLQQRAESREAALAR